jgi:Fe-S-cluster formation regulator IscX/YfhJ
MSEDTPVWTDLESLVGDLRRAHPDVDPRGTTDDEMRSLISHVANGSTSGELSVADLEAVRAMWHWGV